jgi:hypothetical protein
MKIKATMLEMKNAHPKEPVVSLESHTVTVLIALQHPFVQFGSAILNTAYAPTFELK